MEEIEDESLGPKNSRLDWESTKVWIALLLVLCGGPLMIFGPQIFTRKPESPKMYEPSSEEQAFVGEYESLDGKNSISVTFERELNERPQWKVREGSVCQVDDISSLCYSLRKMSFFQDSVVTGEFTSTIKFLCPVGDSPTIESCFYAVTNDIPEPDPEPRWER